MEDIRLSKLRASLHDAIEQWMATESMKDNEWQALDTYTSDYTTELMADSAFNILLAQSDLTSYYKEQNMLTE